MLLNNMTLYLLATLKTQLRLKVRRKSRRSYKQQEDRIKLFRLQGRTVARVVMYLE